MYVRIARWKLYHGHRPELILTGNDVQQLLYMQSSSGSNWILDLLGKLYERDDR